MPSFLGYIQETGSLPTNLTFSFAALMAFYKNGEELRDGALIGRRDGEEYKIMDDAAVLEFFLKHKGESNAELAKVFMSNEDFFGQDLTKELDACKAVADYLDEIDRIGMRKTMEQL